MIWKQNTRINQIRKDTLIILNIIMDQLKNDKDKLMI